MSITRLEYEFERCTRRLALQDIISDILDWDDAHRAYLVADGTTGDRAEKALRCAARDTGPVRSRAVP
jgi:hypothetical protein